MPFISTFAGGSSRGFKRSAAAAPVYTVTPVAFNINEGSALTINVGGTNITNGTYYWTVTNSGDFTTSSGSFSIASNAGSFTVTPTADVTTEGAETFTVSIRSGSIGGTVLVTSGTITINDTIVPTASYLAIAHASSPNVTVYPWSGSGFGTKFANPATLPAGTGTWVNFSPAGTDLAVAHGTTPFVNVYPWSGSGFGTKYADPATLPVGLGFSVKFSPSGNTIAIAHGGRVPRGRPPDAPLPAAF